MGKGGAAVISANGMPEITALVPDEHGQVGIKVYMYLCIYLFLSFATFQAGLEPLQSPASLKSTLLLPQPLKCYYYRCEPAGLLSTCISTPILCTSQASCAYYMLKFHGP